MFSKRFCHVATCTSHFNFHGKVINITNVSRKYINVHDLYFAIIEEINELHITCIYVENLLVYAHVLN